MAPRTSSSNRLVLDLLRPSRSTASCEHLRFREAFGKPARHARHVSTASPQLSEMDVDRDSPPRWSQTPPALKAPVRVRPPRISQPLKVNKDQRKLDEFYIKFLGRDGDKMLSEETKWLAVTNKSFDAGRRGFNDRLAFFALPTLHVIKELKIGIPMAENRSAIQQLNQSSAYWVALTIGLQVTSSSQTSPSNTGCQRSYGGIPETPNVFKHPAPNSSTHKLYYQ
ncbi:hypothetical protein G647_03795 [Cladophialophora carrionii CBS 160.54]|uniref:RNase III domain-containing protein n=1 Tax=Cladophialophora carrionii CBS 160.54 TaxID=1279043 RepID=V9DCM7_9EURO|nr:uncharacterized protein G647_03795 [Cladophialophora carrionii CBS 160.54]ETI24426.1 hypothetical protein G647_03795 [Cladophialophora carrionii CBS 160.54]